MFVIIITIVICGSLLIHYLPKWFYLWRLQRWRAAYSLDQHEPIFNSLYEKVDGFKLSNQARNQHDAFEYTYGEIEFASFIALIALTHPGPDTKFYDLGSGTGKAVIACAMVFEMQQYTGVELFSELYQASIQQIQRLKNYPNYLDRTIRINFINDNFLTTEFSEATLIFINSTALFGESWELLNQRLGQCANGKTIITTSKKLISPAFQVQHSTQVMMSWGIVTAYIHVGV